MIKKDTSTREYKDGKWTLDGVDFDGHFVEWGFSYEPYTYLKESYLSGDEWRKGGSNCLQKPYNIHRNQLKTLAFYY